jgi:tRNA(fMet)-specific endonuclease VapC
MYVLDTNTLYELEVGIAKSGSEKRRSQLDILLKTVCVLPFAETEAQTAAWLRAYLEQQGTPIEPMDTLIAGIALTHRATLVTRNISEFGRVPELQVVDWYA